MILLILLLGLFMLTVYFFYLLVLLWRSLKNLYYAGKNISALQKQYQPPQQKKYYPPTNVYTDSSRRTQARKIRQEIAAIRRANREKRLKFALSRWSVQTNDSFSHIDQQASQEARAYLKNRRKLKQRISR